MSVPERGSIDAMASSNSPVPEKGNRGTLEDCCADESDHGSDNGCVNNVAYHFKLWGGEDIQIKEDEGHLGSAD